MTPSRRLGPGAVSLLLLSAFAVVAALVELRGGAMETRALVELHDLVGATAQGALVAIDDLSDLPNLILVAATTVLVLLLAGHRRDALFFVVGVAGVWLLNPVVKELFQRPRPSFWPSPVQVSEFGFPSGHAANTAALVAAVVLTLPAGSWRLRASLAGGAAAIVVAYAQLALGLHYPSDILAGWLWAGAWVAGVRVSRCRTAQWGRR